MMNPAELAQVPTEVTAESITDLNRDATTMVEDMIQHVTSMKERLQGVPGAKAERQRRDADRLLNSLHASCMSCSSSPAIQRAISRWTRSCSTSASSSPLSCGKSCEAVERHQASKRHVWWRGNKSARAVAGDSLVLIQERCSATA